MKMVDGEYTLKVRAQCLVQFSAMYVCVYLAKNATVAKKMLVKEGENGFLIMVGQLLYHLGERHGFRYDHIYSW